MKNCSGCHALSKYHGCPDKKNKSLKFFLIYDFLCQAVDCLFFFLILLKNGLFYVFL